MLFIVSRILKAGSIDRLGQNSTSLSKIKSSEKSFVNWDNIISYNKTVKDHTFMPLH